METEKKNKKVLKGKVVSNKMDKTATVVVTRFEKHPKYQKYLKISKKYKVHDADNTAVVGEEVRNTKKKMLIIAHKLAKKY